MAGNDRVDLAIRRQPVGWVVIGIGALGILLGVAFVAFHFGHESPEVLAPATVPPVVGLCNEQLIYAADGNASPLFCTHGEINRLAWRYFAKINLRVMALGSNATPTDVEVAVSRDMNTNSTGPIECSAYRLTYIYYGWNFSIDPTSPAISGGCPIQRSEGD